jgi:tripartite-type tricarboxylate transporter receptor subunit TctC
MKKLVSAILVLLSSVAQAQEFPSKPVRFITGAAPGSTGDVLARVLGDALSPGWKQTAVIDNRPGGGGVIASQAVLGQPADGHTVFIAAGSYVTITPWTVKNVPYDVDKDFKPIAFIAEIPLIITARADAPYKSVQELIAFAKANPGKVTYAANLPGTFPNLATEYFAQQAQVKLHYIPYKGTAAALPDVISGRVDLLVEGAAAVGGAIKGGQVRPLAATSLSRVPALPDVPAMAETLPGFAAVGFFAAFVHGGTPEPLANRLSEDFRQALARPDVVKRFADTGNYVRAMTRDEVTAFVRKEREIWGGVIRQMGFSAR